MDVIKKSQLEKEIEEDVVSRKSVLNLINSDWKYEGLEALINGLPAVIPHIKKGYWIGHGESGFYGECSECGQSIQVNAWYTNNMKYCPNCGAKMKTKSESEE